MSRVPSALVKLYDDTLLDRTKVLWLQPQIKPKYLAQHRLAVTPDDICRGIYSAWPRFGGPLFSNEENRLGLILRNCNWTLLGDDPAVGIAQRQ
jgi:hypothetical protein